MEIWKDIEGYEGLYQVSNQGSVKSLKRMVKHSEGNLRWVNERILKSAKNKKGYPLVGLQNNGLKTFVIHRLVAIHFIPNPENKPEVNHKNGIKTDNRIENLEWNTSSENTIHAYKNGLKKGRKGIKNGRAKLTKNQAIEIKYGNKNMTITDIGEKYGISFSSVSLIRLGKSWKHI